MGILDSLSKNPSFVALAALGIGLFIFRDKISEFFSNITGGVEGAAEVGQTVGILNENLQGNLTGIQDILSGEIFKGIEFPTIEFPTIEFPTIEFPSIDLTAITDIFKPREESTDITETPAAIGRASDRGRLTEIIESIMPQQDFSVQSSIENQQFFGGGPSFIGGSISEIPIERLSLNDIIERLGVSASQAVSLRSEAIGFTPEEQRFLEPKSIVFDEFGLGLAGFQGTPAAVSDPQFEGLSAEQIVLRLTGGIISNF